MPTDLTAAFARRAREQRETRGRDMILYGSVILLLINLALILATPSLTHAMSALAQIQ